MSGGQSRQMRRLAARKGPQIIVPGRGTSKRVFIALPSVAPVCHETEASLTNLWIQLNERKDLSCVLMRLHGSLLPWARNDLVEDFLNREPRMDYLLFLDSDMMFHPHYLFDFIDSGHDIVSGLYVQKKQPYLINAAHFKDDVWVHLMNGWQEGGQIEVDGVGMGLCLIKREVFEKIDYPWFDIIKRPLDPPQKEKWGLRKWRMWGEDFSFCYRAKEAGYKIVLDCSAPCMHVGTYHYGPDDLQGMIQAGLATVDATEYRAEERIEV